MKEESEGWGRFFLARFSRVANELFKYQTVKSKMLRGKTTTAATTIVILIIIVIIMIIISYSLHLY